MMINQIGGLDPLKNIQSTQRKVQTNTNMYGPDTVSVSDEARELAEKYLLDEVAAQTPDVRADLVAQVKERIKAPGYINAAVISSVADRYLESIGL